MNGRVYTQEFKAEALELLASSGKSCSEPQKLDTHESRVSCPSGGVPCQHIERSRRSSRPRWCWRY